MLNNRLNRKRGAALGFVVGSTLVVVLIGLAFIFLIFVMGGHREATHTHDAGTLNVAKQAPVVQVFGEDDENRIYGSVSDDQDGKSYSLRSINRVMGHSLLTTLNESSMKALQLDTAASAQNAKRGWIAANGISSRLSAKLNKQTTLHRYYNGVTQDVVVKMFGGNAQVAPKANSWKTSCMHRGSESNIRLKQQQLPPGVSLEANDPAVVSHNNEIYLKGYYPIDPLQNGRYINFVPFERFERDNAGAIIGPTKVQPHLVSLKDFQAESLTAQPYPEWENAVPNAFECVATAQDMQSQTHELTAAGITSINEKLNLEIPNGFVRIKLKEDHWHWFPQFIPGFILGSGDQEVPKSRTEVSGSWFDPFGIINYPTPGVAFTAKGEYGHQYYDSNGRRTLYQALYANYSQDDQRLKLMKALLLNRVNQIQPGTSWKWIEDHLKHEDIEGAGDTFIIGKDDNGHLVLVNERRERSRLSKFVRQNLDERADGKSVTLHLLPSPVTSSDNKLTEVLNWRVYLLFGFIPVAAYPVPADGATVWHHGVDVTAGTGVNGALLDISQSDDVYAFWTTLPIPVDVFIDIVIALFIDLSIDIDIDAYLEGIIDVVVEAEAEGEVVADGEVVDEEGEIVEETVVDQE